MLWPPLSPLTTSHSTFGYFYQQAFASSVPLHHPFSSSKRNSAFCLSCGDACRATSHRMAPTKSERLASGEVAKSSDDGLTIDQGIACVLMLVALALTYLIH
ncbi:putative arabinogalactan protein/22/41 [Helianthus debilis subsp. tardiflorus]